MAEKHIYTINGKFAVKNIINGECITFGIFDTLNDAINCRDELEEYGWPYQKTKPNNKVENYIFKENEDFILSKKIGEYEIIFGKFKTLKKAQYYKYRLIENAWHFYFTPIPFKYGRYIKKYTNYSIIRKIEGKTYNYGNYKFLDDAISRRDELVDNNWEMDDKFILFNLGITELNGKNHNIGKIGKNYIVYKWENKKCIFLAKLPNLKCAIEFRDKIDLNKSYSSFNNHAYFLDTEYIQIVGKYFRIGKNLETFGQYNTLKEAILIRDALIENNWDPSFIKQKHHDRVMSENNRYIHKHNKGFTIFKRVNGELINFGYFDDFEEALKYRDYLEENNWEINNFNENKEEKYDEYIFTKNDGKYYIKNEIDGEMRIFGIFDDPIDAIDARLECLKTNWKIPSVNEKYYFNKEYDKKSNIMNTKNDITEHNDSEYLNSIFFPVTVGKSFKNRGWAIKRRYLNDFIPILPYENKCKANINGIDIEGTINIHTRLFYFSNKKLEEHLKALYDVNPETQINIDFPLEYGKYKKRHNIKDKNLFFRTKFSKSFKKGMFAIPRSISRFIIPILPYESHCEFISDNIITKGKFNLEFRFRFKKDDIIPQLRASDNEDLEIILNLEEYSI